jgi:GT2 family glycosyltransferase
LPRVSTIVPIFNGVAYLPAFFESLQAALPDGSELILVDDGSSEEVWGTVPELPRAERVVRLRNETNLGYSAAVNRAFPETTGDVIVQLNTDLILDPECIGAMVDLIKREDRVGIVGSKLVYPSTGRVQHIGMAFGNHTKAHVFLDLPASHPLCGRTRQMQITTGATVAMTRRVLDLVGPLDESYFNHNEDLDHCLMAVDLGLRNFTCAESVAHHWESKSGPARFAGRVAADGRFWARWGGRFESDLGRFVDEALDYVLDQNPRLEATRFQVLDLSRGADQPIILERLGRRWPGIEQRVRSFRQANNPAERLWLSLLLPHWLAGDPTPFVYLVDRHRELEENVLWFEERRRLVQDELVVDLKGTALQAAEMPGR